MADLPPGHGVYLYGDLDLHIISASNLPNVDMVSGRLRQCFSACTGPPHSPDPDPASFIQDRPRDHDAHRHGKIITTDPYVTVRVPNATVARTRVLRNTQDPTWDQWFCIPLAHPVVDLEFRVKDNDLFCRQLIGTVNISAREIKAGEIISGSFPLRGPLAKLNSTLKLELKFTPVERNPVYQAGIAGDPNRPGVRHTYFPLRKGCGVTLYQDAHVVDRTLPDIGLYSDAGGVYRNEKCWEDICRAISEAHHLIYIVGWSVFHKIKLIREPTLTRRLPRGGDLTLGDLLKFKSGEGVRVLLLIWDDKTSHGKYFINKEGVMQTHDEETRNFFKHSSVNCVLVPRSASGKLGYIKQQVVGSMFTHHQKCVLVDTQALGNNRKITAFIGGIDLCHGRYDTPEHQLFRDVDTVSKDDFHNPTFPPGMKAPRQPRHDLHCRIEGPAAYDVLINFEQRWRKATRCSLFVKGKKQRHDDSLFEIGRFSWILSPTSTKSHDSTSISKDDRHERITEVPMDNPDLYVSQEDDPNNWHVQIFRSIDSGSVEGFPTKKKDAGKQNLIVTKDVVVDISIQAAYIQAIRSAQYFIYIENQCFLGSSYAWPTNNDAGADNPIPIELALKIASKIGANERFAVYIVIPMWPEGDPKSAIVQEVLFWQNRTMQMMYQVVARQLKKMGLVESHPQDYLNFYCLGKCEENSGQPPENAVSESYKSKRFMIYVHANGMVVDDEYILLGSANINQRSLAGTKDTEIAMGAYQPQYTWAKKKGHPHGQVYGYRMSLWAEHLGVTEGCFKIPEGLHCVKRVNQIAGKNWNSYKDQGQLQGHLLQYPIQVDQDGNVGPLQGSEEFPDVGGKVVGAPSNAIPHVLTT
ncbi:hypothetical protein BT93_I0775 [Corymbia citriodora subsp. variegata]|nr:hypothetical protein BT93_I0775 [Corymbia citriodora subsp. variegata]